mgnify:CR=1 FL=1
MLSLKHDNYIKDRKNVTIFLGEEIKIKLLSICGVRADVVETAENKPTNSSMSGPNYPSYSKQDGSKKQLHYSKVLKGLGFNNVHVRFLHRDRELCFNATSDELKAIKDCFQEHHNGQDHCFLRIKSLVNILTININNVPDTLEFKKLPTFYKKRFNKRIAKLAQKYPDDFLKKELKKINAEDFNHDAYLKLQDKYEWLRLVRREAATQIQAMARGNLVRIRNKSLNQKSK